MSPNPALRQRDTGAANLPRDEYPRPQFERQEWQSLNGRWQFAFDDDDRGLEERWFDPSRAAERLPLTINVPFVYQSELSGIDCRDRHDVVWYRRAFRVPSEWDGRRVILHFGAVDYRAWVWVNGQLVAFHEGGHTPFQADVTAYLAADNLLVVRVEDVLTDLTQPRGKQYWKEEPEGIFYTPSTGIWQTVWLEPVRSLHVTRVQFTPNAASAAVAISCTTSQPVPAEVKLDIRYDGRPIAQATVETVDGRGTVHVQLPERHVWSPEQPALYQVTASLVAAGVPQDEVRTYFGLRDISVADGRILLNGEAYVLKLVLDQGYYPGGLLTAGSDEAIRRDVELARAMGFNGVRKHQKVEDPRYLYWADRLGLLVWGEMANSYDYSDAAVARLMAEWQAVIARDYNHPCIVAWVPLNESWGVPDVRTNAAQAHFLLTLYHQTKALDPTRLVISNDGWEHARSDLCTVHDYSADPAELEARYGNLAHLLSFQPSERDLYAPGFTYCSEPIVVSECGGIAYRANGERGWGYTTATDAADLLVGYERVVGTIAAAPLVAGYCYTQFADVEQEINGLLTTDRQPKVPLEAIRAVNDRH